MWCFLFRLRFACEMFFDTLARNQPLQPVIQHAWNCGTRPHVSTRDLACLKGWLTVVLSEGSLIILVFSLFGSVLSNHCLLLASITCHFIFIIFICCRSAYIKTNDSTGLCIRDNQHQAESEFQGAAFTNLDVDRNKKTTMALWPSSGREPTTFVAQDLKLQVLVCLAANTKS